MAVTCRLHYAVLLDEVCSLVDTVHGVNRYVVNWCSLELMLLLNTTVD